MIKNVARFELHTYAAVPSFVNFVNIALTVKG
jgi:hypothetical protein